jgi:hypothetical protein
VAAPISADVVATIAADTIMVITLLLISIEVAINIFRLFFALLHSYAVCIGFASAQLGGFLVTIFMTFIMSNKLSFSYSILINHDQIHSSWLLSICSYQE